MTYWKIEHLKQHLEIEKQSEENFKGTITKNYIKHLETQLKLMMEGYEAGLIDGRKEEKV